MVILTQRIIRRTRKTTFQEDSDGRGESMKPEKYNHKNSEAKSSNALTPAPAALHQNIQYKRSKQESDFLS
jgi:hypothetical protein